MRSIYRQNLGLRCRALSPAHHDGSQDSPCFSRNRFDLEENSRLLLLTRNSEACAIANYDDSNSGSVEICLLEAPLTSYRRNPLRRCLVPPAQCNDSNSASLSSFISIDPTFGYTYLVVFCCDTWPETTN